MDDVSFDNWVTNHSLLVGVNMGALSGRKNWSLFLFFAMTRFDEFFHQREIKKGKKALCLHESRSHSTEVACDGVMKHGVAVGI